MYMHMILIHWYRSQTHKLILMHWYRSQTYLRVLVCHDRDWWVVLLASLL